MDGSKSITAPEGGGGIDLDEIAAMHNAFMPLYHSLGHIIRSKIQGGEWVPGQQIPSERRLMEMCGLSRATVRQGIEYLVREGVLYRVQGKGTFVASPKLKQGVLRLLDFAGMMKRNGLQPTARLLGKGCSPAPADVRRALRLSEADAVLWMQRLLSANQVPLVIETCYVPAERFAGLLDACDGSAEVLDLLYRRFGVRISTSSEAFEPVILESHEASLLGVKRGVPALWVEEVGLDEAQRPTIFCSSLLRGDRCRFYVGLALA